MINFSDEWVVQTLAADRQQTLHDDARKYRLSRDVRNGNQPARRIRRAVGLKMMELGQSILRVNAPATDAEPVV
jgi:hypothetical protein